MAESSGSLTVKGAEHKGAKLKAAEVPKKVVAKDTAIHKISELRGALQDPDPHAKNEAGASQAEKDETQLNASTRRTFESVVFREYNALQSIFTAVDAMGNHANQDLVDAVTAIKRGAPPSPTTMGSLAGRGLTADQLYFYADFTASASAQAAKNKLDTPDAVLAQASLYMQRTDHYIPALGIAKRQLEVLQRAAKADVVDFTVPAENPGFAGEVFIYDENGEPATAEDMKAKRILGIVVPTKRNREKAKAQERAHESDKQKKKNEKKDQKMRYGGVRFVEAEPPKKPGQLARISSIGYNEVTLTTSSLYEKNIVGISSAVGATDILRGAKDMELYGRRIHNIIEARVDLYRKFGMPLGDINPRVMDVEAHFNFATGIYEVQMFPANNPYEFFQAEKDGLIPEQIAQNAFEKTKKDIDKVRAEQKKKDASKALTAEKEKFKAELVAGPDAAEEAANKTESERLTKEKNDATKEMKDKQRVINLQKEIQAAIDSRKGIMGKGGITEGTITPPALTGDILLVKNFQTQEALVIKAQTDVEALQGEVDMLKVELDSALSDADRLGTTTNVGGVVTKNPDPTVLSEALSLRVNLKAKTTELAVKQADKRKADTDLSEIIRIQGNGLSVEEVKEIIAQEKEIKLKIDLKTAARTALGLGLTSADPTLADIEALQKVIDTKDTLIAEVGVERIQTRQLELLNTYEGMVASIDTQNTRLQQHMGGELPNVPDVPHLAGYPRMYLRTLQILFGEEVLLPGTENEAKLQQYMHLVSPEDFVRISNTTVGTGFANMYDAGFTEPTPTLLQSQYDLLSDRLLSTIRSELDSKVVRHELGKSVDEQYKFDAVTKLKAVVPDGVAVAANLADIAASPLYLPTRSKQFYFGNTPEEVAYQIIITDGLDLRDTDVLKKTIDFAKRIIQYRKDNPHI